jgi:multidrug efflux pump subunit AcrB
VNSEQTVAVAKVIKEKAVKEASKNLDPGKYDVELLVRILGSFTKGEDYEQRVTAKINYALLASLALSKVNKETRDTIVEDFLMSMGRSETSDEHKKLIDQIKDEIQPKLDEIKGMTTTKMTGKVTTDLSIEVIAGKTKMF